MIVCVTIDCMDIDNADDSIAWIFIRYIAFLKGCVHTADVDGCFQLLDEMRRCGVRPRLVHHNIALDCCVAAGKLDMAFSHFNAMVRSGTVRPSDVR